MLQRREITARALSFPFLCAATISKGGTLFSLIKNSMCSLSRRQYSGLGKCAG